MNMFEFNQKIFDLFLNDKVLAELVLDREIDVVTEEIKAEFAQRIHQQDRNPEEFNPEELPMIAIYFSTCRTTANDFMNLGILRIEIFAEYYGSKVAKIRNRIVEIMHSEFDERIRGEGQRSSGIKNVYKYRLEFTPLVFT